jgi:hypothetical protein
MFRRRALSLTVAFIWAVLPAPSAEPQALRAWYVDSLVKVFPSDPPGKKPLSDPVLWAARNQHVAFQLAVRSSKPLQGLTAEVQPLKSSAGKIIRDITVRPVGYVVVGSHTKNTPLEELIGEAPGWYPDPLLDFPLDLEAGRTHSLWITVAVPADAVPGVYHGAVVVRAARRTLARAEFRLKVLTASVPSERSLKVTNWFSLDDKTAQQFYGVAQFSPDWWTLVENVANVMADHRQNIVITSLMGLIQPHADGTQTSYDFTNFDRWVETFQKAGVIGYIEGSHLLGRAGSYDAALNVNTFQLDNGKVIRQTLPPDDPHVEPFLIGFLTALNGHLEDKGWKSIYYQHILDEAHGIEPPYYARFAALVHRYLPGVPTLDAVDASHMPQELQSNCDTWVPQLGLFDDQMDLLRQRIQGEHEVWFYTCLFPNKRYLNRLIDYSLLKVRLLHWLNFRYNFTGYLHWGWNFWSPEPMNDTQPVIDNNTELLPAGDAFIVYPDRARKSVYSSIRLEAMREGIEDYEMLRALKAKDSPEADTLARSLITSFTDYVREPATFRKAERNLLEALSK